MRTVREIPDGGCETDATKLRLIREHIVQNLSYDGDLAVDVRPGWAPDLDAIYGNRDSAKKSICFGLTALFNAMLRSVGVPAMLVMGYVKTPAAKTPLYHAYSKVYHSGKWERVDITFEMTNRQNMSIMAFIADDNYYHDLFLF